MPLFLLSRKHLIISYSTINAPQDDGQEQLFLYLYELNENNSNATIIKCPQVENNHKNKDDKNNAKNDNEMICGAFSHDDKYLAACDSNKRLFVWSLSEDTKEWLLVNQFEAERKLIKTIFSYDGKILAGDKSGDVYSFAVDANDSNNKKGKLLMGHCSMLLDMALSVDGKYLVTCDRDEKIRISFYPNAYNILMFCLGHKEFVSSVVWLNDDRIVSGSGDRTLRVWNIHDGREVISIKCGPDDDNDDDKYLVKKLVINSSARNEERLIAVSFYKTSFIDVYHVVNFNDLKLIHHLPIENEPIDICFDLNSTNSLWVLLPREENPLSIYEINLSKLELKSNLYEDIVNAINCNKMFQKDCIQSLDEKRVDGLFKHWFDNVEVYLQNKRHRQQSAASKFIKLH